ncbi:hypothetical protein T484DRAFT_1799191, partial [Baffinella frigidus]
ISPPWAALIRSLAARRALTPLPSPNVDLRAPPPPPALEYLRDRERAGLAEGEEPERDGQSSKMEID